MPNIWMESREGDTATHPVMEHVNHFVIMNAVEEDYLGY